MLELNEKLTGMASQVPMPNVPTMDLTCYQGKAAIKKVMGILAPLTLTVMPTFHTFD